MSTEDKRKLAWEIVKSGIILVVFLIVTLAVGVLVLEKELKAIKDCPTCATTNVGAVCPWQDACGWIPITALLVGGLMAFIYLRTNFPIIPNDVR